MSQRMTILACMIFMLLSLHTIQAQGVKKYITIELVTNSRCPICASRVPLMHNNIAPYSDHIDQITFFASFPYSSCEFYQQNTALNNARVNFYMPPGTPTAYVWGQQVSMGSGIITQAYIEERLDEMSLLGLTVEPASAGFADITIDNLGINNLNNYTLYAFLVETEVTGGPLQNYQNHYNVAREHLSGLNGQQIDLPGIGSSQTWNFEIPELNPIGNDEFKIIAYVQAADKSILNSGSMLVESSTSIKDISIEQIAISPNPSQDHIFFSIPDNEEFSLQVLNMEGKIILAQNTRGSQNYRLDTSALPAGVYVLKLHGKTTGYSGKFVKS